MAKVNCGKTLIICQNKQCLDNNCYFQDYETNAKGPTSTN